MHRFRFGPRLAAIALCTLTALGSVAAQAQSYPSRPVRMIVPLAPGGSMDTIARAAAHKLTEATGQNFVVDNRPGAGSSIGLETAGTPRPVVDQLNREIVKVMHEPEMMKRLVGDGSEAVGSSPAQFRQHMATERDQWTKVIKQAGISGK